MIDIILGSIFAIEAGIDSKDFTVPIEQKDSPFTLTDIKSCLACHQMPTRVDRKDCNEEILKINNNGVVIDVVRFEQFINQFAELKDYQRCDLVMADSGDEHKKIVFCDLCCYEEKYVEPNNGAYPEGKRAKARQQMKQSVKLLISNSSTTAVNLFTYAEKVCLFAWRDYNSSMNEPIVHERGNVLSNMQSFIHVPSTSAKQLHWEEPELCGFFLCKINTLLFIIGKVSRYKRLFNMENLSSRFALRTAKLPDSAPRLNGVGKPF